MTAPLDREALDTLIALLRKQQHTYDLHANEGALLVAGFDALQAENERLMRDLARSELHGWNNLQLGNEIDAEKLEQLEAENKRLRARLTVAERMLNEARLWAIYEAQVVWPAALDTQTADDGEAAPLSPPNARSHLCSHGACLTPHCVCGCHASSSAPPGDAGEEP